MPRAPKRLAGIGSLALLALALTLGGSACTERGPLAAPTLEPLEVRVGRKWLRDRRGRVLILRGATLLGTDSGPQMAEFAGPAERALERMETLGMNLVRLPLSWWRLEPKPGGREARYLQRFVDPVVRMAAAHGLAVVLSMRPWPLGPCTGDDPAIPPWVCQAMADVPGPEGDPACAFWRARSADGTAVRGSYARAWALIARHYAEDARVVGFDVLDEPWRDGCASAEEFQERLRPYYDLLHRRIRAAGATQALLYQPQVGVEAGDLPLAPFGAPVVFAPHVWSERLGPPAEDGAPLAGVYRRDAERAAELGGPLLVGAYGGDQPPEDTGPMGDRVRGTSPSLAFRSRVELDRQLAGGAFRALDARAPVLSDGAPDASRLEAILALPYARRIAGIPTEMRFEPRALEFALRFEDDPRRRPPDPTEIHLPARELYPQGFEVEIEPAGRFRFDETTQRLLVYRGAGSSHRVRVFPRAAD